MVFEYAVDPAAISNWQDFRYVIDQCGVHNGRIVAEYPAKWKRKVYRACKKSCRDVDLKRIEEKLHMINDRLSKIHRPYDEIIPWLDNAEEVDKTTPFHAIISYHNPRNRGKTLIAKELTEETPLWKIERQVSVPRVGKEIAEKLSPLFRMSSAILIVDPHFDAAEERFRNPLARIIEEIAQCGRSVTRIEYHLLAKGNLSKESFENGCNHLIAKLLPRGMSMKFIRWKDFDAWQVGAGGKRLHPRFVLTDIGGILVEWGLDEGPAGDTVDMLLLEQGAFASHWAKYQRGTSPFEFVDEVALSGKK